MTENSEPPKAVKITVNYRYVVVTFRENIATLRMGAFVEWLIEQNRFLPEISADGCVIRVAKVARANLNAQIDSLRHYFGTEMPYTGTLDYVEYAVSRYPRNWWRTLSLYGNEFTAEQVEAVAVSLHGKIVCDHITVCPPSSFEGWKLVFSLPRPNQNWEEHITAEGIAI
ncbi:MAG TPA: hypothetical protein VLA77_02325 [Candidatus Saccharimonadales bacterium]|nr:hypothetical protein [Candidatus Saccharimonadales bacterium]